MKRIAAYTMAACLLIVCIGCGSKKNNLSEGKEVMSHVAHKETTGKKTSDVKKETGSKTEFSSKDEGTSKDETDTETGEQETTIRQQETTVNQITDKQEENVTPQTTTSLAENQPPANQGGSSNNTVTGGTPVERHGALHVSGVDLTDEHGQKMQLYGMSTHGLSWFPQYVNYEAFKTLRDDWNTNCVRLAMYTAEYNGYSTGGNKEELKQIINNGVSYATDLGMYVIIDWHVLNDNDPNVYKADAILFFKEMSAKYSGYKNVIYEICNEPNGWSSWDSIKSYANEVIPVIRANDPDAVIIVGTPTWSQDIDKALASPLSYDNIMYALHFYAATHTEWLRNRAAQCIDSGLPVFISEFGICDASGNGGIDYNQSTEWMNLIKRYNLSYCCWNLANKAETSSVIASWCNSVSGWSEGELSESGKWIRNQFRSED